MKRGAAILLVAVLLTTPAGAAATAADRSAQAPNIVFILADDIGYGDIGAYGGRIATPNIDALAQQGMRFVDAHSPAALCAPSRFSLLTGSYPYRNGRPGGSWDINYSSGFSTGAAHLADGRHLTIAEILQRAGYATAFIGKMHVGGDVFDRTGNVIRDKARLNQMDFSRGIADGLNEHGFNYVFGLTSGIQHEPFAFFENGQYKPLAPGDPADNSSTVLLKSGTYNVGANGESQIVEADVIPARVDRNYDSSQVGRILAQYAVQFIEEQASSDSPFLLYYASQAIHVPHTPPVDFNFGSEEARVQVRGTTGGATSDMIVELDLQVAAITGALERAGVLQDTLIVFTSDNGALPPEVSEHGNGQHDSNGPWRGYKASIYEGGHRVPFIVRWGDGTKAGSRVPPGSTAQQAIVTHDWVATLYDLLQQDMAPDQAMDSASLLPVLLHGSQEPVHDFLIYQAGQASIGAIRRGDWVLVVDDRKQPSELFNLHEDPQQSANRITEAGLTALIGDLLALFLQHHDRDSSTFAEPRTTPALPVRNSLYRSDEFDVFDDRVVQGEFEARAESGRRISSSYPRAAHEVMFKFSINGTENEFPPGTDQMIYLRPANGRMQTPIYTFGELHTMPLPRPAANDKGEEGPVDVTFRLDFREVLNAFENSGTYTPPNGDPIAVEDFHGVYIMGNTPPLNWDMSSLRPGSSRQMHDADGDGIYELTLTFEAQYNRPLNDAGLAVWDLQADISEFPGYRSDQPLVDAIHNLSLEELLQLTRDDGGMVAGARWPDVWTRDAAWGALLAVTAIAPDTVRRSLMLKVDEHGRIIQDLGTGGSWPVSTDRVAWTVAAWELYAVAGDREWLRQAFDIARRSAAADLHAAFDAGSGLFYGESSFLDWREQSYPRWMQPADIYQSQNLGTNALHYAAWRALGRMARALGEPGQEFDAVADAVRDGMNANLWQAQTGYYGQFLYGRTAKSLSGRAEALGESFAVLFNIVDSRHRDQLVSSMPVVPFGVPSFWPYSSEVPPYHNAGIWPQVGGFWAWAAAEAGNTAAVEHALASLYRAAALFLTNKENMVAETGHFEGTELNSDRLIGSVGASLATVYRVLLGMRFNESSLEFRPFIPRAYDGRRELQGFRYRRAILDIEVEGFGNEVAAAYLDGELLAHAEIPMTLRGQHRLRLVMNGETPRSEINLVQNLAAPETPVAELHGPELRWGTVPGAETYRVYRNGERVSVTAETRTPANYSGYLASYQVSAVSRNGVESFLSEPVRAIAPGGVDIVETRRESVQADSRNGLLISPDRNRQVEYEVAVAEPGCFSVDVHYANGSGPVNSGNSAALRSLLVDGTHVGALVFPHRGKQNWNNRGYSNALPVHLSSGEHSLVVAYTARDQNMRVDVNDARIGHLRLTRLAPSVDCLSAPAARGGVAGGRKAISLNAGWEFKLSPAKDAAGGAKVETVDLPHTWNASDSANKASPYFRGTGRYRRDLRVPENLRGKSLFLYFEAVNQVADVAVNGKLAARHVGGYSAFTVDITRFVELGAANEIQVRVSNEHDQDIPPLNADFTFYGGIYRDVWLLALDPVHFAIDEYAATEYVIETIGISEAKATVALRGNIANRSDSRRKVRIDSELVDANGTVVASASVQEVLQPGKTDVPVLAEFKLSKPHLWSPESPYLYRVRSTIRDGRSLFDQVEFPLGLRWIEVDAKQGFRLNGKPYRLFGTNRHQDYERFGNALPNTVHRRDLEIIKGNGFNFLRLAHYPQDPAVLRAADELGLLVWEETPIVNLIDPSDAFRRNSIRMLREMIRQHRQHPSIIFWGYMNEVMLREPEPAPDNYRNDLLALAAELEQVVKQEDASRPTVMALSRDEIGNGVPLWEIPDVLAFNLYFGWYYEDFSALGDFLDEYHDAHPDKPIMISEYGAGSDERVHSLQPVSFDFSTEFQQRFHEQNFAQILARPWLVGSAVWNQFDFGSNHRQDSKFAINQKGLWYYDRTPKDIAWFYKAQLSDQEIVHIAVRDWLLRAGSRAGDAMMPVHVYSNGESVELLLNGKSLGTQIPNNAKAAWMVEFQPGENVLSARTPTASDQTSVHYVDRTALFEGGSPGELAVNSGGTEQIVDSENRVWEADRSYVEGSWGYIGGDSDRQHRRILGTDTDPLYQTRRTGQFRYQFDVPRGTYDVQFHLADLDNQETPVVFRANGQEIRLATADAFTGRVEKTRIEIVAGEGLLLESINPAADGYLNGLVLRRLANPQR